MRLLTVMGYLEMRFTGTGSDNLKKAAGIFIVCLFFLFMTAAGLKMNAQSYDYSFDLSHLELREAYLSGEGTVRAEGPGEDYNFTTPSFILPAGEYTVEVSYSCDTEGKLLVQGNNDCVFDIVLEPTDKASVTLTDDRLKLPNGTDRGKMKLYQTGDGYIEIYGITIHSGRHINRDGYFVMALAALIAAAFVILILYHDRIRLTYEGLILIGAFFAALLLVNIPFLTEGLYFGVDTQSHLKRIEAIATGIRDRQLPVLVGPNYANEYGELVILNPDLFLYIPAFLRLLDVSVPMAYNFYMILVNTATAVTALVCAQRLFGSVRLAVAASVLYLTEPFRLFIMLGLGAGAGMGTAMVFLPFVVTGITRVVRDEGMRWKYLAVGLWGCACSHVLSFALSALCVFVYTLLHIKCLGSKKTVLSLIRAVLLFFALSAGIVVPFLRYYFTDWNREVLTWTDFYHWPLEPERELQNIIALVILLLLFAVLKKTGRFTGIARELFVGAFILILMATPVFPWKLFGRVGFIDDFLAMMQYPRRFHLAAAILIAFVTSYTFFTGLRRKSAIRPGICVAMLLTLGLSVNFYQYYSAGKLFYDSQTGEMNAPMDDYLPAGTKPEWYRTDTGEFSDYDDVEAYSYSKNNTHIDLTYTSKSEGQFMEFPLFYYPGYEAFDQNGEKLKVEKGTHNRVRVYLTCSGKVQELHVRFVVKRIYTVIFLLSLAFTVIWFICSACYGVSRL